MDNQVELCIVGNKSDRVDEKEVSTVAGQVIFWCGNDE